MTARTDVTAALLAYLDADAAIGGGASKELLALVRKSNTDAARTLLAALLVYYATL